MSDMRTRDQSGRDDELPAGVRRDMQRFGALPAMYAAPDGLPFPWWSEATGELSAAVHAFLRPGGIPSPGQLLLVRDYVWYYVSAPCWMRGLVDEEFEALIERASRARRAAQLEAVIAWARELGLDPLGGSPTGPPATGAADDETDDAAPHEERVEGHPDGPEEETP